MGIYYHFFAKSFKKNLAYRAEVWLRVSSNTVIIFVQVAVWRALLGGGFVEGIGLRDMVTYSVLSTLVASLLLHELYQETDDRLRMGDIATDLLKPVRYPLYLFANQLGWCAFQFAFTVIPTLVVAWLLFGIAGPASVGYALAFVVALGIALCISFSIAYLIALLAFWFLRARAFWLASLGLITAFSGAFVPLWFYPPGLAAVAQALPFQYLGYVPIAAYLGRLPSGELLYTLGLGVAWVAALLGVSTCIWSASMRRLVVQGG